MIGKNIKFYRLLKGISQEDLAQKIGLNKMAVSTTKWTSVIQRWPLFKKSLKPWKYL